jgi:predicted nucleotidyltransferase
MQEELSAIFNRKVDLVERESIEQSENYIRRKHGLSNMEPIYGEG